MEAVVVREMSYNFSHLKVISPPLFFCQSSLSSWKNRLCSFDLPFYLRYSIVATNYLLYVRNSFQSRESRKTLLHFPAALLNSPLCIPRENTHTFHRVRKTHKRVFHLALSYQIFQDVDELWIHFASHLLLHIIIYCLKKMFQNCNEVTSCDNIKK